MPHKVLDQYEPAKLFLEIERQRLERGVEDDEVIQGYAVITLVVKFEGDAAEGLERIRSVLKLINTRSLEGTWPSDTDWHRMLPAWFVAQFGRDLTEAEWEEKEAREAAMTPEQRFAIWDTESPRLQDWHIGMSPEARHWLWWGAKVIDKDTLVVGIDNTNDPGGPTTPWTFDALISAAGGDRHDDDYWTPEAMLSLLPGDRDE